MRRRFNQGARAAFLDAVQRYAEAGGLAARFVDAVEATVARIHEEPNRFGPLPVPQPRRSQPLYCSVKARAVLVETQRHLSEVRRGLSLYLFLRLNRKSDQEVSKQNRRYFSISVVSASG